MTWLISIGIALGIIVGIIVIIELIDRLDPDIVGVIVFFCPIIIIFVIAIHNNLFGK